MTLNALIERLEELRDEMEAGGDAEVRLMTQYNWPFENSIDGVASGEDLCDAADGEDEDGCLPSDEEKEEAAAKRAIVYICEGQQLCYGNREAWAVAN